MIGKATMTTIKEFFWRLNTFCPYWAEILALFINGACEIFE